MPKKAKKKPAKWKGPRIAKRSDVVKEELDALDPQNDLKVLFEHPDDGWFELERMKDCPFQRNKHTKKQISQLAKIMLFEGVHKPIYMSERGYILHGHGRRDAALLNHWKRFPVVWLRGLTKDQEYRICQSDNGIGQQSRLDKAKINKDLADLEPVEIDILGLAGFTVDVSEKEEVSFKAGTEYTCPSCGLVGKRRDFVEKPVDNPEQVEGLAEINEETTDNQL